MAIWPIDFGRVKYIGKAPKGAPRWVWRCGCDKCSAMPPDEGLHGPFKTMWEAKRDAEEFLALAETDHGEMGRA